MKHLGTALILLTACGGGNDTSDLTNGGSDVCDDYLACLAEVEPSTFSELVDTYGGSGTCWEDETTASSCISVCESELAQLLLQHPDEPACGGTEPEEAGWPFDEGAWDIEFLEFTTVTCGGYDEDYIEALNSLADGYFALTQGDYPEFWMRIGHGSADCSVDGADFGCLEAMDGASLEHVGTFHNQTSATGEQHADDGEGCTFGVSFEMLLPTD
jgi:hypothetical protein